MALLTLVDVHKSFVSLRIDDDVHHDLAATIGNGSWVNADISVRPAYFSFDLNAFKRDLVGDSVIVRVAWYDSVSGRRKWLVYSRWN